MFLSINSATLSNNISFIVRRNYSGTLDCLKGGSPEIVKAPCEMERRRRGMERGEMMKNSMNCGSSDRE